MTVAIDEPNVLEDIFAGLVQSWDLKLSSWLRRQRERSIEASAGQIAEDRQVRRRIGGVILFSAVDRLHRDRNVDSRGDQRTIDLQRDAQNVEVRTRDLVAERGRRQKRDENDGGA
jgi:hypothetical protein